MTYAHVHRCYIPELYDRLKARYGEDRARDILGDRDPASQADLAAWRALGRKREGAA